MSPQNKTLALFAVVMFGLPLVVVGAVTGFVADKLFSNPSR